jgi:hypothetical protein
MLYETTVMRAGSSCAVASAKLPVSTHAASAPSAGSIALILIYYLYAKMLIMQNLRVAGKLKEACPDV